MNPQDRLREEWKEFIQEILHIKLVGNELSNQNRIRIMKAILNIAHNAEKLIIAEEKKKLAEDIKSMGAGLSIIPEDNSEYEKGYYGSLSDVLSLITKGHE